MLLAMQTNASAGFHSPKVIDELLANPPFFIAEQLRHLITNRASFLVFRG